jgi:hypothetical protein
MYGVSMAQNCLNTQSNRLDPPFRAAHAARFEVDIAGINTVIPHLATKANMSDVKTSIIQWIVATTIAASGLAFTIAQFIH